MNKLLIIILLLLTIFACDEDNIFHYNDEDEQPTIVYGSENTLEIMTWNIEEFTKSSQTIEIVRNLVDSLQIDLIALQEIQDSDDFVTLDNLLTNWQGQKANSAYEDYNLAYLWNEDIEVNDIYEIYTDDSWAFPRNPLIMNMLFNDTEYIVINNHYKAYADSEAVERRRLASERLKSYIDDNFPNDNVVVLGDLNDSLTDSSENNVFQNFIDSENYLFTDMEVAQSDYSNWSYLKFPSHLDHILISNELYDEFENENSKCSTQIIESLVSGGKTEYIDNVSDHRPVVLKLSY